MPGWIGLPELVLLLIVVLLVFGPKRLPEMGRSLGAGLRGFKDSISGEVSPMSEHAPVQVPSPATNGDVTAHREGTVEHTTPRAAA